MAITAHRIRRQSWRVRAPDPARGFELRTLIRDHGNEMLLPVLEPALDRIADAGTVRIPRLELRLRVAPAADWRAVLPQLIEQELQLWHREGENSPYLMNPNDRSAASPVTLSSFDNLLIYLRSGAMPWHMSHASSSEIHAELCSAYLDGQTGIIERLMVGAESKEFIFRLLQLLPANTTGQLIEAIAARLPPPAAPLVQALAAIFTDSFNDMSLHKRIQFSAAVLSERCWLQETSKRTELTAVLRRGFDPGLGTMVPEARARFAAAVALFDVAPVEFQPTANTAGTEHEQLDARTQTPLRLLGNAFSEINRPDIADDEPRQDADIYLSPVSLAGLVLIHPFVDRLFQHCGICHANARTLSAASLSRAAALLHFIATGRAEVYEFELGLIKILLGLAPESPLLIAPGLLTQQGRNEAETLLASVIEYWEALKSTSIDGLRGGFLQRRGFVRKEDASWRLHVDPAAYDMLLDQLPWGIGVIKLPWMSKALFTDWERP